MTPESAVIQLCCTIYDLDFLPDLPYEIREGLWRGCQRFQSICNRAYFARTKTIVRRFGKINNTKFLERTTWSRLENAQQMPIPQWWFHSDHFWRFWHGAFECICSFRQCSRCFHAASRSRIVAGSWESWKIQFLPIWTEHIYPHVSEQRLSQRVVSIILKCIWTELNKRSFYSCRNNVWSFVETLEIPRIDDCFP